MRLKNARFYIILKIRRQISIPLYLTNIRSMKIKNLSKVLLFYKAGLTVKGKPELEKSNQL
ncbi:hypothetical protein RCH18_000790 [Flavobacterium sp. PL11]|nr:hypothetical protein [Flavobacterium sp. PL11]